MLSHFRVSIRDIDSGEIWVYPIFSQYKNWPFGFINTILSDFSSKSKTDSQGSSADLDLLG